VADDHRVRDDLEQPGLRGSKRDDAPRLERCDCLGGKRGRSDFGRDEERLGRGRNECVGGAKRFDLGGRE